MIPGLPKRMGRKSRCEEVLNLLMEKTEKR